MKKKSHSRWHLELYLPVTRHEGVDSCDDTSADGFIIVTKPSFVGGRGIHSLGGAYWWRLLRHMREMELRSFPL